MAENDPAAQPAATFESCLDELEKVVKELEGGDLTLERSLQLFERGMSLSDTCRKQLEEAETRVGKLTNHKVFGDAMAILAGDSLLTLAFQVLAELPVDGERKSRLVAELATAAGTVGGMIGGQVADLEGEGKPPDAQLLETIHRAKTGALLRASLRMGAIYAGADGPRYTALSCYGEHVGLAFQIVDDILDVEESSEALGKTAGKDAQQHKITFPAVYGLAASRRMAEEECARAHAVLEPFGARAVRLHELADLIVHRKS